MGRYPMRFWQADPWDCLMGLSYTTSLTPMQSKLKLTDNAFLKYCQVLMKCLRTFHTQLKEFLPEPTTKVCPSLKSRDWVYMKVYQGKITLQLHWKGPAQLLVITNPTITCKGCSAGATIPSVKGSHRLQTQRRVYHLSQQSWVISMNLLWSNVNRSTIYNPANRL